MVVLCGHSGSGKDTLMNKVVEFTSLKPVVSYTTRPIRHGEINGVSYNFISEEMFKDMKSNDFFIETSGYRGWLYGMAKSDCNSDRIVVLDPCGLRSLERQIVNIISFFIEVPERERLLRLTNRGDDITEICRRIISDRDTFRGVEHEVNYAIQNNNIKVATFNIVENLKLWGVK